MIYIHWNLLRHKPLRLYAQITDGESDALHPWRYSLVVRTGGFEPLNPGSNPGSARKFLQFLQKTVVTRMSELVKEAGLRSAVAKRMGSNPIPSIKFPSSLKIRW